MTLNLITLATVKAELGIIDTAPDEAITAMIPKVSADVRRILNCQFDTLIPALFDETADTVAINYDGSWYNFTTGSYTPHVPMGQVLYNPEIPADTYVNSFSPTTGLYGISGTPTDAGDYVYPSLNISQWATVAKMVYYRISKQTTSSVNERNVTSKSIGSVSITYADGEINKQWNYPQLLINDLGVPYSEIG